MGSQLINSASLRMPGFISGNIQDRKTIRGGNKIINNRKTFKKKGGKKKKKEKKRKNKK